MFNRFFSWESCDNIDNMLVFYNCVLKIELSDGPYGKNKAAQGLRVSFITVDLRRGTMELSNRNEQLEEDDDALVIATFKLSLNIAAPYVVKDKA